MSKMIFIFFPIPRDSRLTGGVRYGSLFASESTPDDDALLAVFELDRAEYVENFDVAVGRQLRRRCTWRRGVCRWT